MCLAASGFEMSFLEDDDSYIRRRDDGEADGAGREQEEADDVSTFSSDEGGEPVKQEDLYGAGSEEGEQEEDNGAGMSQSSSEEDEEEQEEPDCAVGGDFQEEGGAAASFVVEKVADKQLTDNQGEIGYFLKKGTEFLPMTNFSVSCMGYVMESASSSSSEGFRFRIIPTSFSSGETATASDLSRYVFNLLLKHMG